MNQLTLFEINKPYKYIFDTSSFLSQKDNEPHRRHLFKNLWGEIDELIRQGCIVTCSEVKEEIKDEDIIEWFQSVNCQVLDINDAVQTNVIKVVTTRPELVDFKQVKSSCDAFIIATAMEYNLTVVTEENKDSYKKIPQVCKDLGVKSIDIIGLCEEEGWLF